MAALGAQALLTIRHRCNARIRPDTVARIHFLATGADQFNFFHFQEPFDRLEWQQGGGKEPFQQVLSHPSGSLEVPMAAKPMVNPDSSLSRFLGRESRTCFSPHKTYVF